VRWRAKGLARARRLLRAVLVNRLVFTPVTRPPELPAPKGPGRKPRLIYELTGEGSLSKLFEEISASLMVFEPVFSVRHALS